MKVLITGGHFTPALAVIEELKGKHEIVIAGRKNTFEGDAGYSYEYQMCQKLGIPFEELETGRLQRKVTKHTFVSLVKLPNGFFNAYAILKRQKPDVILSFGGYLSVPIVVAGYILKIPIVIHEQTQKAGLANRYMQRFASKVCISFESSQKFFDPMKTVLTSNPIRKEVFVIKKNLEVSKGKKIIYITGGSGGSHFLNELTMSMISDLVNEYVVIHQTGDSAFFNDYEKLIDLKQNLPEKVMKDYMVRKFIFNDEIGWILKNASLIISRSGINSVCEILALGKLSILIPLPHGQVNEQLENAELVERVGIGKCIKQEEATVDTVKQCIKELLENEKDYKKNKVAAQKLVQLDAGSKIVSQLELVYETRHAQKK